MEPQMSQPTSLVGQEPQGASSSKPEDHTGNLGGQEPQPGSSASVSSLFHNQVGHANRLMTAEAKTAKLTAIKTPEMSLVEAKIELYLY